MTLWADRAEEAWLCIAIFGEERGSWLCNLEAEKETTEGDGDVGSGTGNSVGKKAKNWKKKKPKHDKGGLGARDALGIGLSFLGALGLASFMTTVQVGRSAAGFLSSRCMRSAHRCSFNGVHRNSWRTWQSGWCPDVTCTNRPCL